MHSVPEQGDVCAGYLTDGTKFDSSVDRGQPFDFTLGQGQVIQGWDQGLTNMWYVSHGSHCRRNQ